MKWILFFTVLIVASCVATTRTCEVEAARAENIVLKCNAERVEISTPES